MSRKKSKRLSDGKPTARQRLREGCVFYLDENLCNCRPIQRILEDEGISYERHFSHFPGGTEDHIWLEYVGRRGWIVFTKDKGQRLNPLEKTQLETYRIREFAFSSGNINKQEMAEILQKHLRRIFKIIQEQPPPFVASLTKTGVHIRFPKSDTIKSN